MFSCLLAIICAGLYWIKDIYINEPTIKQAITKNELKDLGKDYIICERIRTTGYDWCVVGSNNIDNINEYCNIKDVDPFSELDLEYEFVISNNKYVFYVDEKTTYYSEEMHQQCVEYAVSGWDILYPIKREEIFDFFKTSRYIVESDTKVHK